jgi:hypothetical protein
MVGVHGLGVADVGTSQAPASMAVRPIGLAADFVLPHPTSTVNASRAPMAGDHARDAIR